MSDINAVTTGAGAPSHPVAEKMPLVAAKAKVARTAAAAKKPAQKSTSVAQRPAPAKKVAANTATAAKKASRPAPAPRSPAAKATKLTKAVKRPSPANAPSEAKPPKKAKLVRDSFTIPKLEYTVLEDLKQRAAKLTHPVKKSELLRAGIKALAAMPDAAFKVALAAVPAIKTGRPTSTP